MTALRVLNEPAADVRRELDSATAAKKCHACGCFHDAIATLETTTLATPLADALVAARGTLVDRRYDCIGCDPCFPAAALNHAGEIVELPADAGCEAKPVVARSGWPPLPGDFDVLRGTASVAVCTLHSDELRQRLAERRVEGLSIVGTMRTENLGIERLLTNLAANAHITSLIVCGADTPGTVGHFPGQSLLALHSNGLDNTRRIVDARGKRPVLKNLGDDVIERFRGSVSVVDLRGCEDVARIEEAIRDAASAKPATNEAIWPSVDVVDAQPAKTLRLDPAGYFVIYVDDVARALTVEHFGNDGALKAVLRGKNGRELMTTLVERGAVSRLDHAGYLGRELERAERALLEGARYVQDMAPGPSEPVDENCGCGGGSC